MSEIQGFCPTAELPILWSYRYSENINLRWFRFSLKLYRVWSRWAEHFCNWRFFSIYLFFSWKRQKYHQIWQLKGNNTFYLIETSDTEEEWWVNSMFLCLIVQECSSNMSFFSITKNWKFSSQIYHRSFQQIVKTFGTVVSEEKISDFFFYKNDRHWVMGVRFKYYIFYCLMCSLVWDIPVSYQSLIFTLKYI